MGMDKQLLEKNKTWLESERARLGKLLSRVEGTGGQAKYPEIGSGEDENASEVAMYATNIAEEHDLAAKLQKVENALARIARGTYGVCTVGGEAIPEERLRAVPEAENCIEHDAQ